MVKVSAIITTHNRYELLKKAIDSVLNQTYKNIECIVVDDKSQDETEQFMKSIVEKNNNIKYIRINDDKMTGGNYARNLGIKNSNGEYIAFLDDDDEWFPEKIEKQVKILEDNKDVGIVVCGRKLEYNPGKVYLDEKTIDNDIKDYSKKILYNIIGATSMMMFRKRLLQQVNYFDENIKFWQEYDLTIRICQISKVAFINEILTLYRININDKNRKTNKFEEWLETTKYINNKYNDLINNLTEEEKKKVKALMYCDAANRCSAIGDNKRKKMYFKKAYEMNPTVKNYIKYIFNIDKTSLVKLIVKIKGRKSDV